MSDTEQDGPKTNGGKKDTRFKPGEIHNPAGRPKGARNKFAQDFVYAFAEDFAKHGQAVIEKIRSEDPGTYMRTACAILPKVIEFDEDTKDVLERVAAAAQLPFNAIRDKAEAEDKPATTH